MKTTNKLFYFMLFFGIVSFVSGCCSTFSQLPWCPEPDQTLEDFSFIPSSITRLCPTHIGGDREFDGHGPDVTARATLSKRNNNKEVWVTLYLHAKETRSDWTEAEGTWERILWTVPAGKKIISFETNISSEANYRDTDHALDRPSVQGGNLVRTFEIMGDTGGNDVGNCTSDDVYMNVYFNEIRGKMQEE